MIIRLKSVATNYNYRTNNLKDYFEILKDYYLIKICNESDQIITSDQIDNNSYLELKIRNSIFELQFIAEILGHDLILQAEHSSKEYLCFMIYDDYME